MAASAHQEDSKRLYLFDHVCLAYLALIGFCLIFFHKTVADWPRFVVLHAAGIFLIVLLIHVQRRFSQSRIARSRP